MGTINFAVNTSEVETGSTISASAIFSASDDNTRRRTIKVGVSEVPISFADFPPGILVLRLLSLANAGTGDPAQLLHWGYATGVYQHELAIGDGSVVRCRQGGPVTDLYVISGDVVTPTEFWLEYQVWSR